MNIFSLTPQHLVICKVSLFSYEQKKVQMIIPVTVTPLCLSCSKTKIHLTNSRKVFTRQGAPNSRTQIISHLDLGLQSQHSGITVFCFLNQNLFVWFFFSFQSNASYNNICILNPVSLFIRRFFPVPNSHLRSVIKSETTEMQTV